MVRGSVFPCHVDDAVRPDVWNAALHFVCGNTAYRGRAGEGRSSVHGFGEEDHARVGVNEPCPTQIDPSFECAIGDRIDCDVGLIVEHAPSSSVAAQGNDRLHPVCSIVCGVCREDCAVDSGAA